MTYFLNLVWDFLNKKYYINDLNKDYLGINRKSFTISPSKTAHLIYCFSLIPIKVSPLQLNDHVSEIHIKRRREMKSLQDQQPARKVSVNEVERIDKLLLWRYNKDTTQNLVIPY